MSGRSTEMLNHSCLLCCSRNSILTDIYLKKYAVFRTLLEEILLVELNQEQTRSRMLCHKCIFKLKLQEEFAAIKINKKSNTKMCIICDEKGHTDLTTASPNVMQKLELWNSTNTNLKLKANGLLCIMCYYKLELLEELRMLASTNLINNEICDNFSNSDTIDKITVDICTNNKKLVSVKDLVESGLIKVGKSVFNDSKMYINLLKVNLISDAEHEDILKLSQNSKLILKNLKVQNNKKKLFNEKFDESPRELKKKRVRILVESSDSEGERKIASKKQSSKKQTVTKTRKTRKSSNSDENLNIITIHKDEASNNTELKRPIIVLTREDILSQKRKRSLEIVNEVDQEEVDQIKKKVTKLEEKPVNGEARNSDSDEIIPEEGSTKEMSSNNDKNSKSESEDEKIDSTKESTTDEIDVLDKDKTEKMITVIADVESSPILTSLSDTDMPMEEEVGKNTEKNDVIIEGENNKNTNIHVVEESTNIAETKTSSSEEDDVTLPKFVTDSESSDVDKDNSLKKSQDLSKQQSDENEKTNKENNSSDNGKKVEDNVESLLEDKEIGSSVQILLDDEKDETKSEDELALIAEHINSGDDLIGTNGNIAEVEKVNDLNKKTCEMRVELNKDAKEIDAKHDALSKDLVASLEDISA